ncbi:MAG: hypothetical protein H0Z29_12165 [Candidatus Marinimicrobia bacterium]|nr:hypothetical protein [Candidatus Neomarinimicrobiota bacterium]
MSEGNEFISIFNTLLPIKKVLEDPSGSNIFVILFISGIIGFSFWVFVSFGLRQYRPCSKGIEDAKASVDQYSKGTLTTNFEELNQEMSSNPLIGNLWSEYDKTLVKIKRDDGTEDVFSTIEASYFFNEANILESRINLKFYNAVPGILTGLGILGTFVGLT